MSTLEEAPLPSAPLDWAWAPRAAAAEMNAPQLQALFDAMDYDGNDILDRHEFTAFLLPSGLR